jgi:hypothetical protein
MGGVEPGDFHRRGGRASSGMVGSKAVTSDSSGRAENENVTGRTMAELNFQIRECLVRNLLSTAHCVTDSG